jgi:hypothetical protein
VTGLILCVKQLRLTLVVCAIRFILPSIHPSYGDILYLLQTAPRKLAVYTSWRAPTTACCQIPQRYDEQLGVDYNALPARLRSRASLGSEREGWG